MKVLPNVKATDEQLTILRHDKRGSLIIRGAAGSGKTTTALLRMKVVTEFFALQFQRTKQPLNILVLTYNRTLAGYIEALAIAQSKSGSMAADININVDTFGGWAKRALNVPSVWDGKAMIVQLGAALGMDKKFICNEVDYALGRFMPANLNDYLTAPREGRGQSPQMPTKRRQRLMDEVIKPYIEWKQKHNLRDWNDLAVALAEKKLAYHYHIVVVDETQDFHANRIRGVMNQLSPQHSLTFVLDSAQRIYPNFFKWSEVGIVASSANIRTLSVNYRNTKEIAAFAAPLIDGIDIGQDGSLPNFASCTESGPLPIVLVGLYGKQADWAINYIKTKIDLTRDSVAFLHPKGWFGGNGGLISRLNAAGLAFEDLTRERDWPITNTNIGLSTMHSAKGLEFDHIIAIGLSGEALKHGTDEGDVELEELRRLLAMAVGRARRSVVIGYKPSEATKIVSYLKPGTFREIKV